MSTQGHSTRRADLRLRAFDSTVRRLAPRIGDMDLAQLRRYRTLRIPDNPLSRRVFGAVADGVEVVDTQIDDLPSPLPLRLYRPTGAQSDGARPPVLVFFHGGGWVIGDVTQTAWMCSAIAARVGVVVASVGYRLAPEHRFPAAADDAYAGLCWVGRNAERIGGDTTRLAVMGVSAGGNLVAGATQRIRDEGGPHLVHQILLYPSVDVRQETSRATNLDDAPMLPIADRRAYLDHYTLGKVDPTDPRLSPLCAHSLADLPPALVITAEHDPLRDEARRYAERLRADGVDARYTEYVGMCHGFMSFPGLASGARQALAEICQELDAALFPVHHRTGGASASV